MLPAGLEDCNVELYVFEGRLKGIYAGKTMFFSELPGHILAMFMNLMLKDTRALIALQKRNIIDPDEQLLQYGFCLYGGFNSEPDLNVAAGKFNPEFWDCGLRDHCIFKCEICKGIVTEFGTVSKREIEVIRLVQSGMLSKEIAVVLGISFNTVNNTIAHIFEKVGVNNRAELINWAIKNQII